VSRNPKTHPSRKLKGVKVKLSPQVCESDRFELFCGYNVKTSTVGHQ